MAYQYRRELVLLYARHPSLVPLAALSQEALMAIEGMTPRHRALVERTRRMQPLLDLLREMGAVCERSIPVQNDARSFEKIEFWQVNGKVLIVHDLGTLRDKPDASLGWEVYTTPHNGNAVFATLAALRAWAIR